MFTGCLKSCGGRVEQRVSGRVVIVGEDWDEGGVVIMGEDWDEGGVVIMG